jgi:hypothetical protein
MCKRCYQYNISNSIGLSPSRGAASRSVTQEFPNILWNPKLHYRVHKSPPLVPTLSQVSSVHTTASYLSKIYLILSSHLRLCLPSGIFSSGFPSKILYALSFLHPCYMLCPSHPPWLHHSNYTWWRVQAMKLLIIPFLFIYSLVGNAIQTRK